MTRIYATSRSNERVDTPVMSPCTVQKKVMETRPFAENHRSIAHKTSFKLVVPDPRSRGLGSVGPGFQPICSVVRRGKLGFNKSV